MTMSQILAGVHGWLTRMGTARIVAHRSGMVRIKELTLHGRWMSDEELKGVCPGPYIGKPPHCGDLNCFLDHPGRTYSTGRSQDND